MKKVFSIKTMAVIAVFFAVVNGKFHDGVSSAAAVTALNSSKLPAAFTRAPLAMAPQRYRSFEWPKQYAPVHCRGTCLGVSTYQGISCLPRSCPLGGVSRYKRGNA